MSYPFRRIAALAVSGALCAERAYATDWHVDAGNPNCPGSGTQADPFCTISDAIAVAQNGDHVLVAPATYSETLRVDRHLRLIGTAGAATTIVDGLQNGSVLFVDADSKIDVEGMTFRNGFANAHGGGIFVDQGAELVLDACVVRDNTTNSISVLGGSRGFGGGIWVGPNATLVASATEIANNRVMADEYIYDAINAYGGGIAGWASSITLVECLVEENRADVLGFRGEPLHAKGAGIWAFESQLTVIDSTVQNNSAGADDFDVALFAAAFGGGLYLEDSETYLLRSTVADNSVIGIGVSGWAEGGGLYVTGGELRVGQCTISGSSSRANETHAGGLQLEAGAGVEITNSTISTNTSDGDGGGLRVLGGTTTVLLDACTIALNSADRGGGVFHGGGDVAIGNSLLGDNSAANGTHECSGTLRSLAYNLIEDDTGCSLTGDPTGVITGVDPMLGALEDNGGQTHTHALLVGSPALESANPDTTKHPGRDQRGGLRPVDSDCDSVAIADLGAIEAFAATWSNYGEGWPGTLGVPALTASAPPIFWTQITVDVENSLGAATVALRFVGLAPADVLTNKGRNAARGSAAAADPAPARRRSLTSVRRQ